VGRSALSTGWPCRAGDQPNIAPDHRTFLLSEHEISWRHHCALENDQKSDKGSSFAYRMLRSAAALLDYAKKLPITDRERPLDLVDALHRTARLQAVKCVPRHHRSQPTTAIEESLGARRRCSSLRSCRRCCTSRSTLGWIRTRARQATGAETALRCEGARRGSAANAIAAKAMAIERAVETEEIAKSEAFAPHAAANGMPDPVFRDLMERTMGIITALARVEPEPRAGDDDLLLNMRSSRPPGWRSCYRSGTGSRLRRQTRSARRSRLR